MIIVYCQWKNTPLSLFCAMSQKSRFQNTKTLILKKKISIQWESHKAYKELLHMITDNKHYKKTEKHAVKDKSV